MEEGMTIYESIVWLFFVFGLGAAIGTGIVVGATVYLLKRVQKAGS